MQGIIQWNPFVSAEGNARLPRACVVLRWGLPVTKRKSRTLDSTAYSEFATGDLVLQC